MLSFCPYYLSSCDDINNVLMFVTDDSGRSSSHHTTTRFYVRPGLKITSERSLVSKPKEVSFGSSRNLTQETGRTPVLLAQDAKSP